MPEQVTLPDGTTYTDYQADTPLSIDAEKRALQAAIREHGTEGKVIFEQSRTAANDARNASIEDAAARGFASNRPAALGRELTEDYDAILKGTIGNIDQGQIGHLRELDRIEAANNAYLDSIAAGSQLNRDNLASGLSGRGGGGGGGGGGSSSGYTVGDFANGFNMSLEDAGALAGGSANPGTDDFSGSGVRRLFGEESAAPGEGTYGNQAMISIRERIAQELQNGASREEAGNLLDQLVNQEGAEIFSPHQRSFALATLDNYFGLTELGAAGEATANTYSVYGGDYELNNPYTTEGRDAVPANEAFDTALAATLGGNVPGVEAYTQATALRAQQATAALQEERRIRAEYERNKAIAGAAVRSRSNDAPADRLIPSRGAGNNKVAKTLPKQSTFFY